MGQVNQPAELAQGHPPPDAISHPVDEEGQPDRRHQHQAQEDKGHHTWLDDEIEQYRARWPLGTQQRLVFEFAVCGASYLE
jgi:hypothetical protein